MPHSLWLKKTEPGDSVSSYCITWWKESWDTDFIGCDFQVWIFIKMFFL